MKIGPQTTDVEGRPVRQINDIISEINEWVQKMSANNRNRQLMLDAGFALYQLMQRLDAAEIRAEKAEKALAFLEKSAVPT